VFCTAERQYANFNSCSAEWPRDLSKNMSSSDSELPARKQSAKIMICKAQWQCGLAIDKDCISVEPRTLFCRMCVITQSMFVDSRCYSISAYFLFMKSTMTIRNERCRQCSLPVLEKANQAQDLCFSILQQPCNSVVLLCASMQSCRTPTNPSKSSPLVLTKILLHERYNKNIRICCSPFPRPLFLSWPRKLRVFYNL